VVTAAGTTSASFNSLDQLVSDGDATYAYDASEFLTQITDATGTTDLSYSSAGESSVRTRGAAVALDAQVWVGVPATTPRATTCAANLAWIESAMDRGAIIYDIGIDASRQGSRSPYYELERVAAMRRGYPTIPTPWPSSPATYQVAPQPACPM